MSEPATVWLCTTPPYRVRVGDGPVREARSINITSRAQRSLLTVEVTLADGVQERHEDVYVGRLG